MGPVSACLAITFCSIKIQRGAVATLSVRGVGIHQGGPWRLKLFPSFQRKDLPANKALPLRNSVMWPLRRGGSRRAHWGDCP